MKPTALCLIAPDLLASLFAPSDWERLEDSLRFVAPPCPPTGFVTLPTPLEEVEVLIGSWGLPTLDRALLERMPALRMLFYAAGSVRDKVTSESWQRPVRVVTAAAANAGPVAEFVVAQIVLSLKQAWPAAGQVRSAQRFVHPDLPPAGLFRSTVALLGLGHIGRLVAERLRHLSVEVLAYDPVVAPATAAEHGVRLVGLDEAITGADVISCHLPLLPATTRLIRGSHFAAMKPGAVFINTARGAVVHEAEMFTVLQSRPDLVALLDVIEDERPGATSPLFALPNVWVTPHIAGTLGRERQLLGQLVADEVESYTTGRPLRHELTAEAFATSA